jgi:hypothetical protein
MEVLMAGRVNTLLANTAVVLTGNIKPKAIVQVATGESHITAKV